jgi:L-lysine exporter family protein LysE/ArgO
MIWYGPAMPSQFLDAFISGATLTISLIVSFGPQNTFLLRQGLSNTHLRTALLASIGCEIFLIALGVGGVGALVQSIPKLKLIFAIAGSVFLTYFGVRSGWRAATSKYDDVKSRAPFGSAREVMFAALSFSLLNPTSLFDTVVLIGGLAGQFPAPARVAYAIGSLLISSAWFAGLIYGARRLSPLFAKPIAWRIFDGLIAAIMIALAVKLLLGNL